jgi:hypothetical protein
MAAGRIIKLSKNMKPFVSRVVRDGRIQKAFAEQIGRPVGGCVRSGVHAGMSGAAIHKVARDCAKSVSGKKIL